jgi:hypothetical protein
MRIQIVYKNKKLEVVDTVEYDLDVYCKNLSDRLIGVLSNIELLFDIDTLKENESYQRIRHTILDVSGEIKRLSSNLLLEPGQRIVWEDEIDSPNGEEKKDEVVTEAKKPTLSLIQRLLFGKAGE